MKCDASMKYDIPHMIKAVGTHGENFMYSVDNINDILKLFQHVMYSIDHKGKHVIMSDGNKLYKDDIIALLSETNTIMTRYDEAKDRALDKYIRARFKEDGLLESGDEDDKKENTSVIAEAVLRVVLVGSYKTQKLYHVLDNILLVMKTF